MENKNLDIRTYPKQVQYSYTNQNKFIENEDLYNRLITLTSICPKLILAGSLSLHQFHMMNIQFGGNRKPDLDFALTEPLTEEELDIMISLFQLEITDNIYDGEKAEIKTKNILKQKLIRLYDSKLQLHIDIFNGDYDNNFGLKRENLIPINFKDSENPHIIYLQHPSVTISHKMRYAFYETYYKNKKHKNDCIDLLTKDWDKHMQHIHEFVKRKKQFIKAVEIQTMPLEDIKHHLEPKHELNW